VDRFLENNTFVKIVASLLAILLWLAVRSGGEPATQSNFAQMTRELTDKPVKVLYDERNFSLVGEPKVTLQLHGSMLDVVNTVAIADSIKALADATTLGVGQHEVPVLIQGKPPGIEIEPVNVTIRLEANVSKEMNIELVTEGQPKEGLNVGEALVTPKTVIVSGAKSVVELVDKIVATISVDEAEEGIKTSSPLQALDQNGKPVKGVVLSRDRVEVNIPITKPSKSVPLQLSFKGELAAGFAVEAVKQTNAVTLYGPANVLEKIDNVPVPPIDLTGVNQTATYKIKLPAVEGATALQPEEVEVTVTVVAATKKTFADIPIKVKGLKEGQSYQLIGAPTDQISVVVEGAKALLDKLTAQDVVVTLDLTNQPAGRAEMHPQVAVPNYLKVIGITPPTLQLEIKK